MKDYQPIYQYLIILAIIVTVTNCLRLAQFLNASRQNGVVQFALEITLQLISFQTFILSIEPITVILLALGSFITYSIVLLSLISQSTQNVYDIIYIVLFLLSIFVFMLSNINQLALQKIYQENYLTTQLGSPKSDIKHCNKFSQPDQVQGFCNDDRTNIIQNNVNIAVYNNQINPIVSKKILESPQSFSDDASSLFNYDSRKDQFLTFNHIFRNSPIGVAIIDVHCKPYLFNDAFTFITQSTVKQSTQNLLANIKILKVKKSSQIQVVKQSKMNFQDNGSIQSLLLEKSRYADFQQEKLFCTNDSQLFHSFKVSKTLYDLVKEFEISCKASSDFTKESLCILEFESSVIDSSKTIIYLSQEENINTNRVINNIQGQTYFAIYLVNIEEKQKYSQKKVTLNIMNQLFRSFSHEFSTSLNGIQALAQAAEDHLSKNKKVIELYFNPILNSCGIMNSIVQDVRDFSMLLSKQFMIKNESFNIYAVVSEVYALFAKQFEMRNIEFVYQEERSIEMISTDRTRLKQILINLFSNAQKHTQNGQIIVEVKSELRSEDFSKYIRISVQDCGCGIEKDDQERLDKILNNSLSLQAQADNYKNFGIGLMISNQLAQILSKLKRNLGGGIFYASKVKQGSRFCFLVADQPDDRQSDSKTQSINNQAKLQSPMYPIDKRIVGCRMMTHVPGGEKLFPFISSDQKKQPKRKTIKTEHSGKSLQNFDFADKYHFIHQLSDLKKEQSAQTIKVTKKTYNNSIHEEIYSSSSPISEDINKSEEFEEFDRYEDVEDKNQHLSSKLSMKHPDKFQLKEDDSFASLEIQQTQCLCTSVIVIDDEYINIFALQMLLKTLNIKTDCAYDGIEGVKKVLQKLQNPCKKCQSTYNLILMDIDMPGLNGFEATDKIMNYCELTKTKKPIIVAQTAYVDAQTQNRCIQVGMNFFLAKPISKIELKNALHNFKLL